MLAVFCAQHVILGPQLFPTQLSLGLALFIAPPLLNVINLRC